MGSANGGTFNLPPPPGILGRSTECCAVVADNCCPTLPPVYNCPTPRALPFDRRSVGQGGWGLIRGWGPEKIYSEHTESVSHHSYEWKYFSISKVTMTDDWSNWGHFLKICKGWSKTKLHLTWKLGKLIPLRKQSSGSIAVWSWTDNGHGHICMGCKSQLAMHRPYQCALMCLLLFAKIFLCLSRSLVVVSVPHGPLETPSAPFIRCRCPIPSPPSYSFDFAVRPVSQMPFHWFSAWSPSYCEH